MSAARLARPKELPARQPPRTSASAAPVGADHRRRQSPGFRPGQGLLLTLAVLALNPGKVLQFGFDALWELLQEMEDRVYVNAMDQAGCSRAFPIVHIFLNILAREIVTAGTRIDLLRRPGDLPATSATT